MDLDEYRVILLSRDCPEMCLATRTGILSLEMEIDEEDSWSIELLKHLNEDASGDNTWNEVIYMME